MAILQSRMIALINAAIDYQTGFRQLQQLIYETNNRIQDLEPDRVEEAKAEMASLLLKSNDFNLLEDSAKSQATITGEHYRFSVNRKRNEWNREYQRKRRGGITKHHITPDYATEEFNAPSARITPFRAKGQDQKGFTPKKGIEGIDYIPGELPATTKEKLDREIERSFATDIPRGEDLKISNEEVDPDFPRKNR